jgi:hypothetical protein
MQVVDRCGGYLVSCLLATRKKREVMHSAGCYKPSDRLHLTRRSLDLEERLRSVDAECERRTGFHCLLAVPGDAQKARCHRDEAADTCLAEAEVAAATVIEAAAATAAAMAEGSCWVAPARCDSFHLAVAARSAEDSTQVVAASLECIWAAVRYVPWALVPV